MVYNVDYQACPASAATVCAGAGSGTHQGDILERLVVTVTVTATSLVTISDGGGAAIPIVPANTPIGVYSIPIGARSRGNGGWTVTTLAGSTVVATGRFQ